MLTPKYLYSLTTLTQVPTYILRERSLGFSVRTELNRWNNNRGGRNLRYKFFEESDSESYLMKRIEISSERYLHRYFSKLKDKIKEKWKRKHCYTISIPGFFIKSDEIACSVKNFKIHQ